MSGHLTLERPRHRWEDNIEIYLRDIGCVGMDCIDLAQDRDLWHALVNTVMNLHDTYDLGKFFSN
jgi:hypothetical protein